jgi:hypothetical protein
LKNRCPDYEFTVDDIKKLVKAGFLTEFSLRTALLEEFKAVVPGRYGVVSILCNAFLKLAGMFPCQGFVVLTLMYFTDLYATDL